MKAIDHGIDFIHGETREQSAEVLKHAQAKSTLMTMRMAEGQLKSWTSLITTLDDLCDATLMSLKDGHRPSTLISTWQIDYWYARVTKKKVQLVGNSSVFFEVSGTFVKVCSFDTFHQRYPKLVSLTPDPKFDTCFCGWNQATAPCQSEKKGVV